MTRTRSRGGERTTRALGTNYSLSWYDNISTRTCDEIISYETITDEVHPKYPLQGGPMDLVRSRVQFNDIDAKGGVRYFHPTYKKDYGTSYEGKYRCNIYNFAQRLPSNLETCASYGPEAWDKFKPAKPDVSLSVFLAELRELPQLMFRKLDKFRNIGNNYLAVEFGWRPFLSDLRDWLGSIIDVDRRVQQLVRDNGRRIRRSGTLFQFDDEEQVVSPPAIYPTIGLYKYEEQKYTIQTHQKCWFVGSFRYYIPDLGTGGTGKLRSILKLWDLEMGPEQVYNLLPWSWLVDWFTNLGNIISNFASILEDNLAADYAYVMLHTRVQHKYKVKFTLRYSDTYPINYRYTTYTASSSRIDETKCRASASPFGFNFNLSDLTSRQKGILGALGISRLPH